MWGCQTDIPLDDAEALGPRVSLSTRECEGMARLNAKRRRALALERARHDLAKVLNPQTQADVGHVRSSHKAKVCNQMIPSVARAFSPKPLNLDANGVSTKSRPKRWGDR